MGEITIRYGKFDPSAKADSNPTVDQNQPYANIDDLRYDNITVQKNIGTFEHNQIILDGQQEEMPDDPENYNWGWWTTTGSDDFGKFQSEISYTWDEFEKEYPTFDVIEAANLTWNMIDRESAFPTLDITFDSPHSSNGITLYFYPFSDDYANKIQITWYNEYGNVILSGIYDNDSVIGTVGESVTSFVRMKIEMLSTNIRNRFVKIYAINFGKERVFLDGDIAYCNILEEIDPISEKMSINTMNFQVKTHDPEFSHVTGDIENQLLMINQQMTVTYDDQPFGTFFLKTWKDTHGDGTVFDFSADDAVGILDSYPFMGDVYVDRLIKELLREIFDLCFPTHLIDFVLDPQLENERISGLIPTGTCRTALQYICFAKGAIADTSRRGYVWIYPLEPVLERTIPLDKIYYGGGSIESTEYYTGIDLVSHTYTKGTEIKTIYDDVLEAGEHTFNFIDPLHSLSITGGTILESSATYAKVKIASTQHVEFTGLEYIVANITESIRSSVLPGEVDRIKVYDGCTLVGRSDAYDLANHIFLYLKMRKQVDNDIRLEDYECGYLTRVSTRGRPIIGTAERLDIKLRGYRAKLRLLGDVYASDTWNDEGLARLGTFSLNADGGLI